MQLLKSFICYIWCFFSKVKHFQRSPLDCGDIDIEHESGIYKIYPQGSLEGFYVYCDMDTEDLNGAWTVSYIGKIKSI